MLLFDQQDDGPSRLRHPTASVRLRDRDGPGRPRDLRVSKSPVDPASGRHSASAWSADSVASHADRRAAEGPGRIAPRPQRIGRPMLGDTRKGDIGQIGKRRRFATRSGTCQFTLCRPGPSRMRRRVVRAGTAAADGWKSFTQSDAKERRATQRNSGTGWTSIRATQGNPEAGLASMDHYSSLRGSALLRVSLREIRSRINDVHPRAGPDPGDQAPGASEPTSPLAASDGGAGRPSSPAAGIRPPGTGRPACR
jgi:hypothetical protein